MENFYLSSDAALLLVGVLSLVAVIYVTYLRRENVRLGSEKQPGLQTQLSSAVDRVFTIIWSAPERDLYLVYERNCPGSERLLSTKSLQVMKISKGAQFIIFTTRESGEVIGSIFRESQAGYAYIDAKQSYLNSAFREMERRVTCPSYASGRKEELEAHYEGQYKKLFL